MINVAIAMSETDALFMLLSIPFFIAASMPRGIGISLHSDTVSATGVFY
jgi:hypothetical protein